MSEAQHSDRPDSVSAPRSVGQVMADVARRLVANNWKVVLYVVLIILCVLFAPQESLKFIYTEF